MYLNKRNKLNTKEQKELKEINSKLEQVQKKINIIFEEIDAKITAEYVLDSNLEEGKKKPFHDILEKQKMCSKMLDESEEYQALSQQQEEIEYARQDILQDEEVGYWRKHSDLNGYFCGIYEDRAENIETFNCIPLVLSKEDCIEVLNMSKNILEGKDEVTHHSGFFWGESCPEDWQDTVKIFSRVIEETDFDKEEIVYSCWW